MLVCSPLIKDCEHYSHKWQFDSGQQITSTTCPHHQRVSTWSSTGMADQNWSFGGGYGDWNSENSRRNDDWTNRSDTKYCAAPRKIVPIPDNWMAPGSTSDFNWDGSSVPPRPIPPQSPWGQPQPYYQDSDDFGTNDAVYHEPPPHYPSQHDGYYPDHNHSAPASPEPIPTGSTSTVSNTAAENDKVQSSQDTHKPKPLAAMLRESVLDARSYKAFGLPNLDDDLKAKVQKSIKSKEGDGKSKKFVKVVGRRGDKKKRPGVIKVNKPYYANAPKGPPQHLITSTPTSDQSQLPQPPPKVKVFEPRHREIKMTQPHFEDHHRKATSRKKLQNREPPPSKPVQHREPSNSKSVQNREGSSSNSKPVQKRETSSSNPKSQNHESSNSNSKSVQKRKSSNLNAKGIESDELPSRPKSVSAPPPREIKMTEPHIEVRRRRMDKNKKRQAGKIALNFPVPKPSQGNRPAQSREVSDSMESETTETEVHLDSESEPSPAREIGKSKRPQTEPAQPKRVAMKKRKRSGTAEPERRQEPSQVEPQKKAKVVLQRLPEAFLMANARVEATRLDSSGKSRSVQQPPPLKPTKVIGPRDVIVNQGLMKIKIESDYIPPATVKEEPKESITTGPNEPEEVEGELFGGALATMGPPTTEGNAGGESFSNAVAAPNLTPLNDKDGHGTVPVGGQLEGDGVVGSVANMGVLIVKQEYCDGGL